MTYFNKLTVSAATNVLGSSKEREGMTLAMKGIDNVSMEHDVNEGKSKLE